MIDQICIRAKTLILLQNMHNMQNKIGLKHQRKHAFALYFLALYKKTLQKSQI